MMAGRVFYMDPSNDVHTTTALLFWLWIFPASYVIHAAEEFWGGEGYTAYLYRLRGVHMSPRRFVANHALALFLMTVGVVISQMLNFPTFLVTMFGALIFSNGISHTVTAIWDRGYGPGLITSILWIPLGAAAVIAMFGQLPNLKFAIAVAVGLGINGFIAFYTMKGGKLVI